VLLRVVHHFWVVTWAVLSMLSIEWIVIHVDSRGTWCRGGVIEWKLFPSVCIVKIILQDKKKKKLVGQSKPVHASACVCRHLSVSYLRKTNHCISVLWVDRIPER
jgi:hypothetical protein